MLYDAKTITQILHNITTLTKTALIFFYKLYALSNLRYSSTGNLNAQIVAVGL